MEVWPQNGDTTFGIDVYGKNEDIVSIEVYPENRDGNSELNCTLKMEAAY